MGICILVSPPSDTVTINLRMLSMWCSRSYVWWNVLATEVDVGVQISLSHRKSCCSSCIWVYWGYHWWIIGISTYFMMDFSQCECWVSVQYGRKALILCSKCWQRNLNTDGNKSNSSVDSAHTVCLHQWLNTASNKTYYPGMQGSSAVNSVNKEYCSNTCARETWWRVIVELTTIMSGCCECRFWCWR